MMHRSHPGAGASMMWTTVQLDDGRAIRIVVEELPNGEWDWVVWDSGRADGSTYGVRATAVDAIDAVVAAAAILGLADVAIGADCFEPAAAVNTAR